MNGLGRAEAVDDFQEYGSVLTVARGIKVKRRHLSRSRGTIASTWWLPCVGRDVLRVGRQHNVSVMCAEHDLRVIGWRAVAGQRVVADKVAGPLHGARAAGRARQIAYVHKERGIRFHKHEV